MWRNLLPKIMLMVIFFVTQNLKNLPLSKILDIEKLSNVDKPIEAANGLPNECYTSKDYFVHEREKVFFNKWTVVGVASSLPKPCLLYTSPSPRDGLLSRMPSSA